MQGSLLACMHLSKYFLKGLGKGMVHTAGQISFINSECSFSQSDLCVQTAVAGSLAKKSQLAYYQYHNFAMDHDLYQSNSMSQC